MTRPLRLLTVGHSYVVALNRRLPHELARVGSGRWEITAAAPAFVHGDLRPIQLEHFPGEACRLVSVPAYLTRRTHFMLYGRTLRRLLHERWDMVHCWEEPYVVAGFQLARWTPRHVPFVFWTAQNLSKRYPPPFAWFERFCVRRCAGWQACGHTIVTALEPRGYSAKPHRVTPLGVDMEVFRPDAAAGESMRRSLGWAEPGPPVVGYLGRLAPEKGLRVLTAALDALRTPWRALFVGGGKLEDELRAWAGKYADDRVRVVTGVPHDAVPRYVNAMNVLAAPSQTIPQWKEQLGRMLIEGMACGVPVVGSDSGEIPYVVGDAGVVIGEADIPGWSREIGTLLESPTRRKSLSVAGRERVECAFAWPVIARQHIDFFNTIVDSRFTSGSSSPKLHSVTDHGGSTSVAADSPVPSNSQSRKLIPRRSPRRILSVGHSYVIGANRALAHAMQRAGGERWEVRVVAPRYFHGKDDLRPAVFAPRGDEPCPVISIRAYMTRFVHVFGYGLSSLRRAMNGQWDIVHAWEEPYILAGAELAASAPRSACFVFRTAQSLTKWYPPPFNLFERYSLSRSSGWICSGRLVAENLGSRPQYAARPMACIPLGVDTTIFRPDLDARMETRRSIDWAEDGPPVVGYLGRFVPEKGLNVLTAALDALHTPWRALFLGGGKLEGELRAWAARYTDGRVRVLTDVSHDRVAPFVSAMDILAAPSQTTHRWKEQFGRMLIEGMACGVAVVGSDSGEIPHVIGDTGAVVPETDISAWTRTLGSLLENPGRRLELGAAGRDRAETRFAWPIVGRKHLEFFEEVIANKGNKPN